MRESSFVKLTQYSQPIQVCKAQFANSILANLKTTMTNSGHSRRLAASSPIGAANGLMPPTSEFSMTQWYELQASRNRFFLAII